VVGVGKECASLCAKVRIFSKNWEACIFPIFGC
jgi:hypothetical protein